MVKEHSPTLRHELKYYVPYADFIAISRLLDGTLKLDRHAGKDGTYFIRSLYFDTYENSAFYEKQAGILARKKVRMRLYGLDGNKVKFEIKNKVDEKIFKESAWISKKDAIAVVGGDCECLLKYKNNALNRIYALFKAELYRPVMIIDYKRRAYVHSFNNVRITFDYCLTKSTAINRMFDGKIGRRKVLAPRAMIMEVKYEKRLPDWIGTMIGGGGRTRTSISKFCLSREGEFE